MGMKRMEEYLATGMTAMFIACMPVFMASSCEEEEELEDSECYSPTQNTDIAYEDGAKGCPCDPAVDEDVCVGGAALMCSDSLQVWEAVEDGPCWEVPDCLGEVVNSESECLVDDAYCEELENGLWCTGPSEPSCPEGYEPLAEGKSCPEGTDSAICFVYSEGYSCQLSRIFTIEECEFAGGQATPDPGDGSLLSGGCPEGFATVGYITADWDEGGLCCVEGTIDV